MGRFAVQPITDAATLAQTAPVWEALAAGVPFREPTWLLTWWRHYGEAFSAARRAPQLFALVVEDDGRLVGLAPWYVERSLFGGRVIRELGSGRVCSDYLTVLCADGNEGAVAAAIVEFLSTTARNDWDRLELDSAADDDPALAALFAEFRRRGVTVEHRPGPSCWQITLPDDWETYLARLSKSHRKQLRRLATHILDTPRAVWHTTVDERTFDRDWTMFLDLHQRRRYGLGEAGCFADRLFAAFHEDVARQLLRRGELRLHRLEVDGRAVAAEYHLARHGTIFAYQSGIEPSALEIEPGRTAAIAVIRSAIEAGFGTYDLLRGDEPYKAHFRGVPRTMHQVTVVNPHLLSRIRHAALRGGRRLKQAFQAPTHEPVETPAHDGAKNAAVPVIAPAAVGD